MTIQLSYSNAIILNINSNISSSFRSTPARRTNSGIGDESGFGAFPGR
jgi:hypothetical protein